MSSRLDYDQNHRPRQARRKRVTSRAVMIALSVIAVVLAVGGVLAPQISYAREASRFDVISQEVDEAAREVESLQSLEEAERLLLTLRSDEARPLRKQLKELSQSSSKVLSSTFKKDLAEHATAIEGVISGADRVSAVADAAKKASTARAAEPGDPQTWFDVSSSQLVVYADISVEELERVDDGGTVTLGRVQNAKGLLATYRGQIAELQSQLDAAAERTDELETLLADVTEGVLAESQRVIAAERTVDDEGFSPEALGIVVDLEEWETTKTELDAATTELESAIKAETFAVNEDGDVIGVQEDSELPDGAIRIPGGEMIRLNYVLPKLQAYVAAADAEGDASKKIRDAIAQAEAAAAELAEQQAAEQNQPDWEEPGYTPPPVTPGDGGNAGSSGSDGGSGTDSGTGAEGSGNPGDAGGGGTAEGGGGGAEGAGGAGEGGDGSAAAE